MKVYWSEIPKHVHIERKLRWRSDGSMFMKPLFVRCNCISVRSVLNEYYAEIVGTLLALIVVGGTAVYLLSR